MKKCNDAHKYGCEAVAETEEEIDKIFRLVKTYNGDYYRNVCRSCENRRARELRSINYKSYNYRKKSEEVYDQNVCKTPLQIGGLGEVIEL